MHIDGFLNFRISGQGLEFESITKNLHCNPDYTYKKGEIIYRRGRQIEYKEDCWLKEVKIELEEEVEDALSRFLANIIPYNDYIFQLTQKYEITLWLSLYPETEQINVHFSPYLLEQICKMGISIDTSVSYLVDFYNGTSKIVDIEEI